MSKVMERESSWHHKRSDEGKLIFSKISGLQPSALMILKKMFESISVKLGF